MDNSSNQSGSGKNIVIILAAVAVLVILALAMTTGSQSSKELVSEEVQPSSQSADQAPAANSETAPNLAPAAGGTAADHKNLPADSETSED